MEQVSKTMHTPGPWTQCDRVVVVTQETHGYATWLANCAVGGNAASEQLANACLVASAPQLLEALRKFTKAAEETRGGIFPDDYQRELDAARVAIENATGEQS